LNNVHFTIEIIVSKITHATANDNNTFVNIMKFQFQGKRVMIKTFEKNIFDENNCKKMILNVKFVCENFYIQSYRYLISS